MSELSPCPFCGSNDIEPDGVAAMREDGSTYHYPSCNDCMASCVNWNTRHTDSAVNDENVLKPLVVLSLAEFSQLTTAQEQIRALRDAFNPRTWTQEQHDAWHKHLPNTSAALAALLTATEPKKGNENG